MHPHWSFLIMWLIIYIHIMFPEVLLNSKSLPWRPCEMSRHWSTCLNHPFLFSFYLYDLNNDALIICSSGFGSLSLLPWWRSQSVPSTSLTDLLPTVRPSYLITRIKYTRVLMNDEHFEATDQSVIVCCCSMVCRWLWWSLLLHPDPAGATGGLCPLLERVLGGQDGDGEPQGLVRRSVTQKMKQLFTGSTLF